MDKTSALRTFADQLFIFGCFTLAASIPVSKFTTSLSLFLMALAWLLQWNWKEKWQYITENKTIFLWLTLPYYLFVLGMLYTDDWSHGLKDLKIKAPLFALPVLFTTGKHLSKKLVHVCLVLISASAITAGLIGFTKYQISLGSNQPILDMRELSPFISHIRLTLILCFAFGYGSWALLKLNSPLKWLLIIPIAWILYFVNLMGNLTGTVIIPLIAAVILIYWIKGKSVKISITTGVIFSIIAITAMVHIFNIYSLVNQIPKPINLELSTALGNKYNHYPERKDTENGHYTWAYLNEDELRKVWNSKGLIQYDEQLNGFPFKDVLIRYMTSLGLNKDAEGVRQLRDQDIEAVQKGIANVFYVEENTVSARIHAAFWELKTMKDKGYIEGSSIAMRLEYWKTGWEIFKQSPIIGIGTGDIQMAFQKAYDTKNSSLSKKRRRRTHNQYLSVAICLGIIGLILFLFSLIMPFILYNGEFPFLLLMFLIIAMAGMLWEDTIETSAGVTLFSFFLGILSIRPSNASNI